MFFVFPFPLFIVLEMEQLDYKLVSSVKLISIGKKDNKNSNSKKSKKTVISFSTFAFTNVFLLGRAKYLLEISNAKVICV